MQQFPVLSFLVRFGHFLSAFLGLVPPAAAIGGFMLFGWHPSMILAGLLGGAVSYVVFKSYVELVAIITDMLLPK